MFTTSDIQSMHNLITMPSQAEIKTVFSQIFINSSRKHYCYMRILYNFSAALNTFCC